MLLICQLPANLLAQRKDGREVVESILNTLKTMNRVSYDYEMLITYPDGNKQGIKGAVFIDNANKEMYNESDLQTVIFTGRWSYKADHVQKEVVIVNNEKHLNKKYRTEMEEQLFHNNSLSGFLDSVVLKKAQVKSYSRTNDTVRAELIFPKTHMIRSLSFSYDDAHKKFVSYSVTTFVPWTGDEKLKNNGTTNYIKCSRFAEGEKASGLALNGYFVVSGNKAILKKYTNYKLNSEL